MKVTNKEIIQNWLYILVIMVLGFFFVGIYILISGNKVTQEATDSFYNYNLEDKKYHLMTEVHNRIDEIEYERHFLLDDEKMNLYTKIQTISNYLVNTDAVFISDSQEKLKNSVAIFEERVPKMKIIYILSLIQRVLTCGLLQIMRL